MFYILFIFGSVLLGYSVIAYIYQSKWMFFTQILSGWCLGAMLISAIGFVSTYFVPLTGIHTIVLMLAQYIISFLLLFRRSQKLNISFLSSLTSRVEKHWSFYLSLVIVGSTTFIFLNASFFSFPVGIPVAYRFCYELDRSFTSSILTGVNYQRKNFFTFSDPYLFNGTFTVSSLPSIYTAFLMNLNCPYIDASAIISFFNVLATSASLSIFSFFYCPNSVFLAPLLYFFNGGSIVYNILNGPKDQIPGFITEGINLSLYQPSPNFYNVIDGVHNCGRGETPHYSILPIHLAFSKISSFSIPLTIFALAFLHGTKNAPENGKRNFLLAGVFAALIPSLSSSIAFFIIASTFIGGFFFLWPFALSLIPKFFSSSFRLLPLWTEYQMNGIFFSQIVAFVDSIGIPYIFLFLTPFIFFNDWAYLHQFLKCFISFVFFCFIREGNDTFANDIAISANFIPVLTMNFLRILDTIRNAVNGMRCKSLSIQMATESQNKDEIKVEINQEDKDDLNNEFISSIIDDKKPFDNWSQFAGVVNFLYYFLVFYILLSGALSIYYIQKDQFYGIAPNSLELARWAFYKVPKDKIILCAARGLNPIPILTGHQVILGRSSDIWRRGENLHKQIDLFEQISKDPIYYMKKYDIHYLLEYKPNLFLLGNQTLQKYFGVIAQNDNWALLFLQKSVEETD